MTRNLLDTIQNIEPSKVITIFLALTIFDFVMKCITAYKARTKRQIKRFICLILFNTCGILPIIYLIINREENKIN